MTTPPKKTLDDIKKMAIVGNAYHDSGILASLEVIICDKSISMEERIAALTYMEHDVMGLVTFELTEEDVYEFVAYL